MMNSAYTIYIYILYGHVNRSDKTQQDNKTLFELISVYNARVLISDYWVLKRYVSLILLP